MERIASRAVLAGTLTFLGTVGLGLILREASPEDALKSDLPKATRPINDPSLVRGPEQIVEQMGLVIGGVPALETLPQYFNPNMYLNNGKTPDTVQELRESFRTPGRLENEWRLQRGFSTEIDIIGEDWLRFDQQLLVMAHTFPSMLSPDMLKLCQLFADVAYQNNGVLGTTRARVGVNEPTGLLVFRRWGESNLRMPGLSKPLFDLNRKQSEEPKTVMKECSNPAECPEGIPLQTLVVPAEAPTETPTSLPLATEVPTEIPTETPVPPTNTPNPGGGGGPGPVVPTATETPLPSATSVPTATETPVSPAPTATQTQVPATPTEEVLPPTAAPTNTETLPTYTPGLTSTSVPTRTLGGSTPTPVGTLGTPPATSQVQPPTAAPTNTETLPTYTVGLTSTLVLTRTPDSVTPTLVGTARPVPTAGPTAPSVATTPQPPTAVRP